jgi:hypothetical protein
MYLVPKLMHLAILLFFYIVLYYFTFLLLLFWGYIVTFTQVLTVYHSEFTLPSFSFVPPSTHSWDSFNRSHFSIFTYVYIILPSDLSSYTLSPHPPPTTGTKLPDRTCSALLFSFFVKKKKNWHFCLFK